MKRKIIFQCFCLAVTLFYGCKKSDDQKTVVAPLPIVNPPIANSGTTYYVSTTGLDSRPANEAKDPATPWRTIQKAANTIPGGATVIIAGGTYIEKVTISSSSNGTAAKPTLFRNKPGETVVIEGNNSGNQWESLFKLNAVSYITIKGLKTQNGFWYGFSGENSNNITIDSCFTENTRASGIYAIKSSQVNVLRNNIRKACQVVVRDAQNNGSQECISIVGCNKFKVDANEVWDVVPVGVGGEGIDSKGGSFDGEISNNYIHDLARAGIYVDAGSGTTYNIRVYGNKVYRASGLAIAGEIGGSADKIYFYNNVVKESKGSGLLLLDLGNGKLTNIYLVNNTFYNNGQAGFNGDVSSFNTNTGNANIQIRNNIFYNKSVANYRYSIWYNSPSVHVVSNNLYYDLKPSTSNGSNSFGLSNLTSADLQSDPSFTNTTTDDFSLKSISSAINKGVVITLPSSTELLFTTDINGKSRGTSNWDMGAFEF